MNEASKLRVDWSKFGDEVRSGVALCLRKLRSLVMRLILLVVVKESLVFTIFMPIDELYSKFKCTSNNGEAHWTILVIFYTI